MRNGEWVTRRFAYQHKRDAEKRGCLLAIDRKDAVRHLGSDYWIRSIWEPLKYFHETEVDDIVKKAFSK